MALFSTQKIQRLTLPESDQWVDIKTVLTAGMRQRIFAASMHVRVANTSETEIDALAFRNALIKEIIVAWSDERPVTPEAIDEGMSTEAIDWIAEQFDSIQVVRSAEQIAFLGSSSPSSPAAMLDSPTSSPISTSSPGLESAT